MPTDWVGVGIQYAIALVAFSGAVWMARLATFDDLVLLVGSGATAMALATLGLAALVLAEEERTGETAREEVSA